MSRIRTALVGVVAAGLMLTTAQVASAEETTSVELKSVALGGGWTIQSPTTITKTTSVEQSLETQGGVQYASQVQQPINPDNSSVWPAKRGVIPVQFKLTKADTTEQRTVTTTTVDTLLDPSFKSIGSNPETVDDYSALAYKPPAGSLKVKDITNLVANYSWLQGANHKGSLRWSIRVSPTQSIFVYYGAAPQFDDNGGLGSGDNLAAAADLRVDTSQLDGVFYNGWANAKAAYGEQYVTSVSLVLDGGWGGDQELDLQSAQVNGSSIAVPATVNAPTTSTTVPGAWEPIGSGLPVQTNEPLAYLQVRRFNDGDPESGAVLEPLSSAQGDVTGQFRQIDGKYIYNLKVESLGSKPGDYKVYMVIDDKLIESPGIFSLK
jgi:hypothetical protein